MKKVVLILSVAFIAGISSCGGGDVFDVDVVGGEFCACTEKEGAEKSKCHDEVAEKYKGMDVSKDDHRKLGKILTECDPDSGMSVLKKMGF